jgi:hypothetical protein
MCIRFHPPDSTGLAFRIGPKGKLEWETEPVTVSADEVLQEKKHAAESEAAAWLIEELKEGEQRSRDLLRRATTELGFSKSTIHRARKTLNLTVRHVGSKSERHTLWSFGDETLAKCEMYGVS